MASPHTRHDTPKKKPHAEQLGNGEGGRAHWPLDLEIHPEREEKPVNVPHPDWDDEDED
jgi:hypothetical protein